MADNFLGEIRAVGFNFAPNGWAMCQGQILPIQQYTALFSLIGTFYGGNGTSNFQLPDLQGRVALSSGQGPGLSFYSLGQEGGEENLTLFQAEMPSHTHELNVSTGVATSETASGDYPAQSFRSVYHPFSADHAAHLNVETLGLAGGSQPHENRQPSLTINYIIALVGVFPPRN